jgi:hypothetical protein
MCFSTDCKQRWWIYTYQEVLEMFPKEAQIVLFSGIFVVQVVLASNQLNDYGKI